MTSSLLLAQNEVNIEFVNETNVTLNGLSVDKNTTFEDIKAILGEPEIFKEYKTGKITYHYADNGIALQTVNGKLLMLGFNYNWDGDKTFPESTFKGKLSIEGIHFDKDSNQNKLEEIKNTEFMEVMPGFLFQNLKQRKKHFHYFPDLRMKKSRK